MGYLDTIFSALWVFAFIISAYKYIVKSTCYFCNTHISMKGYQLKHITFLIPVTTVAILSWWVAAVCLGLTDTVTKVKTNPSQKSLRYTSRRNGVPHPWSGSGGDIQWSIDGSINEDIAQAWLYE